MGTPALQRVEARGGRSTGAGRDAQHYTRDGCAPQKPAVGWLGAARGNSSANPSINYHLSTINCSDEPVFSTGRTGMLPEPAALLALTLCPRGDIGSCPT